VQEKYSEYKQENEIRRQQAAAAASSAITISALSSTPTSSSLDNFETVENRNSTSTRGSTDDKDWDDLSRRLGAGGNISEPCSLSSSSATKLTSETRSCDIKGELD
jgi:hypothetical protein